MRIGMLTSGGDCQCLNATMEAIAKVLYKKNKAEYDSNQANVYKSRNKNKAD